MFFKRPADNRPPNKVTKRTNPVSSPSAEFRPLFRELLSTRAQYEALRSSDGAFFERAVLVDRLHELRSGLAISRRNGN